MNIYLSVSVIFKLIFGHIDSVKLTSLASGYTSIFTGQYYTEDYITFTDVIFDLTISGNKLIFLT